jgi:hypothetical protein
MLREHGKPAPVTADTRCRERFTLIDLPIARARACVAKRVMPSLAPDSRDIQREDALRASSPP